MTESKYIVKQTFTVVRTAEVEAVSAEDAGQVLANGFVAEKCASHEWPSSVPMVESYVVEGDCGITVEAKKKSMTGRQVIEMLQGLVAMYGWVVFWDHTGGGCCAITMHPSKEKWVRTGHGPLPFNQIMITGEDTYGYGDLDSPLYDSWGDRWDYFTVGVYETDLKDGICYEPFHLANSEGVKNLVANVLEYVKNCEGEDV